MKKVFLFVLFTLVTGLCACGGREKISYAEEILTDEEAAADLQSESKASFGAQIYVYVAGCVVNPGVYIMPEGSRVYDAINAAGGVTAEGDESHMNPVSVIHDGDRVVVPMSQEYYEESGGSGLELININQATESELMGIPSIGAAKAKAIISYRNKHGAFSRPEDIMKVSGIKEGTFEKIKDYIEAY